MATVNKNYNIAIEYYRQRQEAFFNFYLRQYNIDLQSVLSQVENFLEKV